MKLNFKEKYLIILIMACFVAVGFYYSYAIFVTKQLQENVVVVKTVNNSIALKVDGKDDTTSIKGNTKKDVVLTFNNSKDNKYYYMVLVKGIKTGVKVSSQDEIKGTIDAKEAKRITVHITNETVDEVELSFLVQTSVSENFDKEMGYSYINNIENYDHSGANKPDIANLKLIPVSYQKTTDTEGYWYKTDINNNKNTWYDYDNGMWANAVLVSDTNYRKYQANNIGTEIEISDILGFYVWIPRFKYYIINSSDYTNYERISNVIFEKNNEQTGTIICEDKISTLTDSHVYSEICKDDVNHHIYDNLSTYTHPAFQNKSGFWVAKFLMGEGEKILPNLQILKKNINEANDISKKTSKSHILTNMEYGAIVILSDSLYGKSGNSLYNGNDSTTFGRIYVNSYEYEVTGCSSEYSSYSKNFLTEKTNKCLEYNNLTNLSHYSNGVYYPIGYVGAGASSTGSVYGIYDLANISGELVAAYVADNNGLVKTNLKYYDTYSYSEYTGRVFSSSNIYNLYRYKYGDAIREHFRSFNENGMWHGGILLQNKNNGIIIRGGNKDIKNASVYTTVVEEVNYTAPFRLTLMN